MKYVVGAPPGPKSRGGLVTVLGGATDPLAGACAIALRDAIAAPAATPMLVISVRRDIAVRRRSRPSCDMGSSSAMRIARDTRCAELARLGSGHASRPPARASTALLPEIRA